MNQSRRAFLTNTMKLVSAGAVVAAAGTIPNFAEAATRLGKGKFSGRSRHVSRGGVEIIQNGRGVEVVLQDDFFLDGAPDPKVGFGRNGFVPGTLISPLRSLTGRQRYAVPGSLNVANYNEVYIWCERFAVPLAVAKIG